MFFSGDDSLDGPFLEPNEATLMQITPLQPQSYYLAEHKENHTAEERLAELRDALFRGRLRLKEKRNELREERWAYSKIEARFHEFVRRALKDGLPGEVSEFDNLWNELQSSRENLAVLQYDYDRAEDEYDGVELDLDEAELMIKSQTLSTSGERNYAPEWSTSVKKNSSSSDEGSNLHNAALPEQSILEAYQSRVGDTNILQEQLLDILHEHSRRNITSHARNFAGPADGSWALHDIESPRDPQSIRDFKVNYRRIMQDLNHAKEDVGLLKQQAVAIGHHIEERQWPDLPSSISSSKTTSKQYQTRSITHTHQSDSAIPYFRKNFRIARARINKWILDRLQSSTIEHTRHKATTLQALQASSMSDETWAGLVLKFWRTDALAADIDSDTWELISSNSAPHEDKYAALISSEAEALRVLQTFDHQFAATRKLETKPKASKVSSFKSRDSPYLERLDSDTESQYESRSI
ncbi:hypothetical protein MMC26_002768 [Xylographa opegraphella]|nr:hypothetical protein [Xylographa opegraphella]